MPSGSKSSEKPVAKRLDSPQVLSLDAIPFASKEMSSQDDFWLQLAEVVRLLLKTVL